MAGATDMHAAPYPNGPFHLRLGGHVPNGLGDNTTPALIAEWVLPFDVKVRRIFRHYYKTGAAHLDLLTLCTKDATVKSLTAQVANPSADDSASTEVDLHADIIGTALVAGNAIQVRADSSQSNEAGSLWFDIELEPTMTRPQKPTNP